MVLIHTEGLPKSGLQGFKGQKKTFVRIGNILENMLSTVC